MINLYQYEQLHFNRFVDLRVTSVHAESTKQDRGKGKRNYKPCRSDRTSNLDTV